MGQLLDQVPKLASGAEHLQPGKDSWLPLSLPLNRPLGASSSHLTWTMIQIRIVTSPHGGSTRHQPKGLVRPHRKVERCTPAVRRPTLWSTPSPVPTETCHHGQTGLSVARRDLGSLSLEMILEPPPGSVLPGPYEVDKRSSTRSSPESGCPYLAPAGVLQALRLH
jgi:hypothetical protein